MLRVKYDAPSTDVASIHLRSLLVDVAVSFMESYDTHFDFLISPTPTTRDLNGHPKALIVPFADIPWGTRHLLASTSTPVYTIHFSTAATAEFAIALWLTLSKRLTLVDASARRGHWSRESSFLCSGSRVLVIGFGRVGREVARIALALGAHVSAVSRTPAIPPKAPVVVYPTSKLSDLAPNTDVLISCLPLTPSTRKLLDATLLSHLPAHAIVINVGRANTLDMDALWALLSRGKLWGAAIDVWPDDPVSHEHSECSCGLDAFQRLPNVILSTHRAWRHDAAEYHRASTLASGIQALAGGHVPDSRWQYHGVLVSS